MELLHSLLYKYRKNKEISQILFDYILTNVIVVIVLKFHFGENEYVCTEEGCIVMIQSSIGFITN